MATNSVYLLTNRSNGAQYVGVTCRPVAHRWAEHKSAAKRGSKYALYNAIRKHGVEKFSVETIATFNSYAEALVEEVRQISLIRPRYNLTAGGEGVRRVWTEAEKEHQSRIKRENPVKYWMGKQRSDETKEKISRTKTGVPRKPPPEHAMEIFAGNMRRAALARRKSVYCVNTGWKFDSVTDAAIAFGLGKATIAHVCAGSRNSVYGFVFKYGAQS